MIVIFLVLLMVNAVFAVVIANQLISFPSATVPVWGAIVVALIIGQLIYRKLIGLLMVTIAARPADEDHPYGHHKAEYFSSGFEGILIIAAALGIIWVAGHRFFDPQPIEQVGWGLALSVVSSALNGLLAWVMFRAAKEHRSIALEADAKHLVTDVWTSVGVVVGIVQAATQVNEQTIAFVVKAIALAATLALPAIAQPAPRAMPRPMPAPKPAPEPRVRPASQNETSDVER